MLFLLRMNIIEKYNKLKVDWNNFKSNSDNKKVRIKDAAEILSTNEAALLSTEIGEKIYFLKMLLYGLMPEDFLLLLLVLQVELISYPPFYQHVRYKFSFIFTYKLIIF